MRKEVSREGSSSEKGSRIKDSTEKVSRKKVPDKEVPKKVPEEMFQRFQKTRSQLKGSSKKRV